MISFLFMLLLHILLSIHADVVWDVDGKKKITSDNFSTDLYPNCNYAIQEYLELLAIVLFIVFKKPEDCFECFTRIKGLSYSTF